MRRKALIQANCAGARSLEPGVWSPPTAHRPPPSARPAALHLPPHVLVEKVQRPFPRKLRRGLVVSRSRVVVEPVLRVGIEMPLVSNVGFLQRLLERRPGGV